MARFSIDDRKKILLYASIILNPANGQEAKRNNFEKIKKLTFSLLSKKDQKSLMKEIEDRKSKKVSGHKDDSGNEIISQNEKSMTIQLHMPRKTLF